jgi:hypothetical protein
VKKLDNLQQRKRRAHALYQGIPGTLIVHKEQDSALSQNFSKSNTRKKDSKGFG